MRASPGVREYPRERDATMPCLTAEEEDRVAQAAIRSSANKSLAVLEKAFIRNGSGRYFVLRTNELAFEPPTEDPPLVPTGADR